MKNLNKIVIGIFFIISLTSFLMASILSYAYYYDIPNYTVIGKMPVLKGIVDAVRNIPYVLYKFESSSLPVYKLYIDPQDYQELKDALPKSTTEFLSEEQRKKASAKFVYGGQEMDVSVSFRGDKHWHWFFEKKSWNIKFDDLFEGTSEIKLIVPHDRGYINMYFSSYRARKFGLPVPDDNLVILQINNGPKAVYYQQEGWTKEFLKKNFGTDNGNLYGERGVVSDIFSSSMFWKKYVSIEGQENNFADLDYLINLVNDPDDERFKKEIVNIFDMDNFYDFQVYNMLMGAHAPCRNHNMRLFFNKEEDKFFLVSWNVSLYDYTHSFEMPRYEEFYDLDYNHNLLVTRILSVPEFLLERNKRLWDYVKNDKNLEEDLIFYDRAFEEIKSALFNDSTKFWRNRVAEEEIKNSRSGITSTYYFLREQLEKVQAFAIIFLEPNSRTPLVVDLQYRSASPMNFNGLSISSETLRGFNFFQLYEDTNSSGVFDYGDLKVSDLKYKDNSLFADNLNKILYSERNDEIEERQVFVEITRKRFFVVSSGFSAIQDPLVSFDISNEVTGSKIEPETHINFSI